jgi:hypothetical protein
MGIASRIASGGGAKGVSFLEVGATVEGVIENIEEKHLEDFQGQLEHWSNGDPKLTPVIIVQTDDQEGPEDDGRRAIYCRSGLFTALREALREAYPPLGQVEDSELIGAGLKVQFYKTEKASKRGFNDRKLYQMRLTPRKPDGVAAKAAGWVDVEEKPATPDDEIPF